MSLADSGSSPLTSTPVHGAWWHQLAQVEASDFSSRHVLVVDDEKMISDFVAQTVQGALGCTVHEAHTGDLALELVRTKPCDVVFTDMLMPGLHGLDLIREIKRVSPDTEVIVFTGFSESFPYVDVIEAGACDIISKPCTAGEIEGKLLRVMRERITRERLLAAEEKYRSLFELSVGSNMLLDAEDLTFLDVNKAFCEMLGGEHDALIGQRFIDFVAEAERERIGMLVTMLAQQGGGTIGDIGLLSVDGREIVADASLTFLDIDGAQLVFASLADVTDRRDIEKQLAAAATTDQLTGLSNRRAFNTQLRGALIRAKRDNSPMSLMLADLDNFKQCNDTHGHQAGDDVLKIVGDVIRESTRLGQGDDGFRLGGDEFAVIMTGADQDAAVRIADRMRVSFADAETHGTTLSLGIASFDGDATPDAIVKRADDALYKAKGQGKNAVHVA